MNLSSTSKNRIKVVAIFILAVFCVFIIYPKLSNSAPLENFWNKFKFHLGLDLQGGTHLVYQADTSQIESQDRESAVEGVRDVIERRVNAFGVSEPVVQTNFASGEYRVIVELAGVKDVDQAIKMIGETPLLEFKEMDPNFNSSLTSEEQRQLDEENKQIKEKAQSVLKRALNGENFSELAREFSEDETSKATGGDLGWARKGMFVKEFEEQIFDILKPGEITQYLVETQYGYHIIKKIEEREYETSVSLKNVGTEKGEGNPFLENVEDKNLIGESKEMEVHSQHILFITKKSSDIKKPNSEWLNTQLSGKHLKRSQVQFEQNSGEPEVGLEFNDDGKDLFAEITTRNVGKPVAIFLDGEPISVPTVNEPIKEGRAVITGRFNIKEAKELVERLNAGTLPVPINLIAQKTVGASLGQDSVKKSLFAGIIGLALTSLFMILYYRLPGLLAVLALFIYAAINLAIYKIIPVTLTLAGVAGFILSIGMAVDANVLVFERMKEELKRNRNLSGSIEEGFKRAWTSILDSNVSTLITALILIWFGTSIIKGFAITLTIGVIISMFSAITVTRSFLRLFSGRRSEKLRWIFGAKPQKTQKAQNH